MVLLLRIVPNSSRICCDHVVCSRIQKLRTDAMPNALCIVKLKHLSEFNYVWIPLPLSARYNGCYYELTAEDQFA